MKKTLASLALIFTLVGCGSTPTTRTEVLHVPVPVPCQVEYIPKPNYATNSLSTSSSLFEKVQTALVEIEQRKIYESELEVALEVCKRKL